LSGPKVVKVVTREEQIATCSALLVQLNRAVTHWANECNRLGSIGDADRDAVLKTKETIEANLKNDNFQQIQEQVPKEISYLLHDLEQRRSHAAEVLANSMQVARQQRKNAATLLREFEKRASTLDSGVLHSLMEICNSHDKIPYAEKVLAEAFNLISKKESPTAITDLQRELASRLSSSETKQSFTDWLKTRSEGKDDRFKKIDKKIAELQSFLGEEVSSEFIFRLRSIELENNESLLNARLDSLVIELSVAVEKFKLEESILSQAHNLLANLEAVQKLNKDQKLHQAHRELEAVLSKKDLAVVILSVKTGSTILNTAMEKLAADNRRNAILSGLASLGYEVNESMNTAFAKKGRIVVQKPNLPGYGVELAGAPDAARLQVRAVTFTQIHDKKRERDVETIWCNDFHKLQELINAKGGSVLIEKSFEIGALPLHIVPVPDEVVGATDTSKDHSSVYRK
jgi:hypothetical protein